MTKQEIQEGIAAALQLPGMGKTMALQRLYNRAMAEALLAGEDTPFPLLVRDDPPWEKAPLAIDGDETQAED